MHWPASRQHSTLGCSLAWRWRDRWHRHIDRFAKRVCRPGAHRGIDTPRRRVDRVEDVPAFATRCLYWSRNQMFEIFDEGRFQGIVGNANKLEFLGLLAIIVFAI